MYYPRECHAAPQVTRPTYLISAPSYFTVDGHAIQALAEMSQYRFAPTVQYAYQNALGPFQHSLLRFRIQFYKQVF